LPGENPTSPAAWQRRFEMIYQRTKDAPITLCAGVCPTLIEFGHYLQRHHRVRPAQLWRTRAIATTSVPGIHTKYAPALRALYGPVDLVEMYIATEGTFAQQRDERKLLVPNNDLVRAFDPPYFRCIGREGPLTRLRYWLDGIRYLDFGRA
jgi:hypothetical protein